MAFKVITDFVEKPIIQITCDRSCGIVISAHVEPGQEHNQQLHMAFAQEAAKQGWALGFEAHLCPMHVRQETEGASRIIVPSMSVGSGSRVS